VARLPITSTERSVSPVERLFVCLQYLLPQHALSRTVYRATRVRVAWFKNLLIRSFIRIFGVDMKEARERAPESFEHFNAFFTRALKPGARPLPVDPGTLVSPVDGTVSMSGTVRHGQLFQAKDRLYPLDELLGDGGMAREFDGGAFATLYLAPYDYHRIHMPLDGCLTHMRYIPGSLFSVNAATVRSVPRLFARNERVVCRFDTPAGAVIMVLVGALNVGSIETVWAGEVAPGTPRRERSIAYDGSITLERGDEMGRFNMGSTVIAVFSPDRVRLVDDLTPGNRVRAGCAIGEMVRKAGQPSSDAT